VEVCFLAFTKKKQRSKSFQSFQFLAVLCWNYFLDFLTFNATADKVTTTIAAVSETSAAQLNSGTVGVGEADAVEVAKGEEVGVAEVDAVGLGEADVLEESDITETVLSPELTTNISPLAES
jgi:hypothetical protein